MKNLINLLIVIAVLITVCLMGCQKEAAPQPTKHLPEVSPLSKPDSTLIIIR